MIPSPRFSFYCGVAMCMLVFQGCSAKGQTSALVGTQNKLTQTAQKPVKVDSQPIQELEHGLILENPRPTEPKINWNHVNTEEKVIAITFDDGPHPSNTPRLLDMLKARGIKATFYVVGTNCREYPEIMKRIVSEGHEVGNHSWSHPDLTGLSAEKRHAQIADTHKAIIDATGIVPRTMRPPYGATNEKIRQDVFDEFGYTTILWSVDPLDWKYRSSGLVSAKLIQGASKGGILLVHDIHATTVDAMPKTLDTLLAEGYKFLTVSQLLARDTKYHVPDPRIKKALSSR